MTVEICRGQEVLAIALNICLTVLTGAAIAAEVRTSLTTSDTRGQIEFMSADSQTTLEQVKAGQVDLNTKIWGDISFPATLFGGVTATPEKRVPAMVILHSSGGVNKITGDWATLLNRMGVATLVVNSFAGRGIERTGENQTQLSQSASSTDALLALKLLASHPLIDAKRIGVIGFSRGAESSLIAGFESFRMSILKSETKFAGHIAVYGGCTSAGKSTGAPMLMLIGELDDHVLTEKCIWNADVLKKLGADIRINVYPGAHHGFDNPKAVSWNPKIAQHVTCAVNTLDFDSGLRHLKGFDSPLAPREFQQAVPVRCKTTFGSHDGANVDAYRKSKEDVADFVNTHLKPAK